MLNLLAMSSSIFGILSILFFSSVAQDDTFAFINKGKFSGYPAEYHANSRFIGLYTYPFALAFYNTTPNAHVFAIAMGNNMRDSHQVRRWVWDANPDYPVHEGSTYNYGPNGAVITDVDGQVAWKTNISTERVAREELYPNGNFMLTGSRGQVLWQSFDHPSDSLLVSQSLRVNGPNKLNSRTSDKNPSPGLCSLVLGRSALVIYCGGSKSIPILSYTTEGAPEVSVERMVFNSSPTTFELTLDFYLTNSTSVFHSKSLATPSYNTTFSFLRMCPDRKLRIYTYEGPFGKNQGDWKVIPLET